jgi:hypothetical protein
MLPFRRLVFWRFVSTGRVQLDHDLYNHHHTEYGKLRQYGKFKLQF